MRTILIVGGGYAGFYTAWRLEKKLRRGEARVVVVDPRPYMTYQPFLPEVLAGSVESRHAAVSLRRHLRRTRLIAGASALILLVVIVGIAVAFAARTINRARMGNCQSVC